jgi:hypothetical protein
MTVAALTFPLTPFRNRSEVFRTGNTPTGLES